MLLGAEHLKPAPLIVGAGTKQWPLELSDCTQAAAADTNVVVRPVLPPSATVSLSWWWLSSPLAGVLPLLDVYLVYGAVLSAGVVVLRYLGGAVVVRLRSAPALGGIALKAVLALFSPPGLTPVAIQKSVAPPLPPPPLVPSSLIDGSSDGVASGGVGNSSSRTDVGRSQSSSSVGGGVAIASGRPRRRGGM